MMELYFKIKLIETVIGYVILALFILFWVIVALINVLEDGRKKRQDKISANYWRKHNETREEKPD